MLGRSLSFSVLLLAGVCLIPTIAHADLRIEEQNSSLESKVTRWIAIKGNKRSIVTRAETKGLLYDAGARYGAYVEIARPDRELLWELDPQERNYREISADAFSKILQKGIQIPRNPDDQPLRSLYRSQTTAIEVVPTGKTRRIAGYDAEQVMARVVVGAQNLVSGNQFNYTFDQEIWITKDDQVLKEVRGFEEAYTEAFGTAASLQQAQVLAGEWNDAFITHLRSVNDRVRALGGFPLSVTTSVTEEAVAQAKSEKNAVRRFVVGTNEVRKLTLESVPDSEFELPVGYVNQDTKVAVAGPKPSTTEGTGAAATVPAAPEHPATTQVATTPPTGTPETVKPATPTTVAVTPMPAAPPTTVAVAPMPAAPTATTTGETQPNPGSVAATGNPLPGHTDPIPGATGGTTAQPTITATSPSRSTGSRPSTAATARPTSPDNAVQPAFVQAAPSNVIVPGAQNSRPEKPSRKTRKESDAAPALAGGGATPFVSFTTTQAPPPPVTVDEPEYIHKKKKH